MANPKLGVDLAGLDLHTTYQGDLALMQDVDNVRAAIHRRLETPLGGLFSHPDYGNPLHEYLSEQMDSTWEGKAIVGIKECLKQEPRITLKKVEISINMESRKAAFSISYLVLNAPGEDNLVWEVDLA